MPKSMGQRSSLPKKVFIKAAHLQSEGKTRNQALGAATGMMRAGRLTRSGDYLRKGK